MHIKGLTAKDLDRLDNYSDISEEKMSGIFVKERGALVSKAVAERIKAETFGTIEVNGNNVPAFEFIDELDEGQHVRVTFELVDKPSKRVEIKGNEL